MIGCVLTDNVEIEHVATFADTVCAAHVPIFVPLSLNETLPVGVPEPGAVTETVAVNVTDCPDTDGFAFETTPTVVFA